MMRLLPVFLSILVLGGCAAPMAGHSAGAGRSGTEHPKAVSPEQLEAIAAARTRRGFAGHHFDKGMLFLNFDVAGIASARDLARGNVKIVEVEHSLDKLEAAKARTVALINSDPAFGTVGIMVDPTRNGVEVSTALLVSGRSSGGGCAKRRPLPDRDPVNGVPIFDERDC